MKRLISFLLILALSSGCFMFSNEPVVAETESSSSDVSWANAYYKFLSTGEFWNGIVESFGVLIDPAVTGVGESIDPSSYPEMALKTQIALYDLNNDGVPELFIYADDALSEYGVWDRTLVLNPSWNYIYTFVDNEIKYIDTHTVSAFMNSKKYPGILNDQGRLGVHYYYLDDNYQFQSAVVQGMKDRKVVKKNKAIYDAVVKDGTTAVDRVLFSDDNWVALVAPWGVTGAD